MHPHRVRSRKIEMAKYADVYIRQKSGSDVALLNGLMHVIIRENLHAAEFVEKNANNFEKLRETVARYTPEYVSEITGVAPELIEDAARAYAKGPNSAIFYTMGITQHVTGTNNVRSVANLALLCGMLGRPGTGVNPLRDRTTFRAPATWAAFPTSFRIPEGSPSGDEAEGEGCLGCRYPGNSRPFCGRDDGSRR